MPAADQLHESRTVPGEPSVQHPLVQTVEEAAASSRPDDPVLRILMLADDAHPADAVRDHIRSIDQHSRHRVTVVNPIRHRKGWVARRCHSSSP